jgi:hypothetical protein
MAYTVITPFVTHGDGERLRLHVNAADANKVRRGVRWRATVTDQKTGRAYLLRGAACGLPGCLCDAAVVREVKGG